MILKRMTFMFALLTTSLAGNAGVSPNSVSSEENGIMQQTRRITGKVLSKEDNDVVVGASILVSGTTIGTITDMEGGFTLNNVPADAKTITVSYIGMASQTLPVRQQMIVYLEGDSKVLDEVMVVAYGTAKKGSFAGAASKISSETLENRAITSLTQALSGTAPGVQVGNNTGTPGTSPAIRIRGISSINDANDPLYVVDGAPYEDALSNLNPEDIESITILKDAVSASLYGARASAGVVIITTKSGKKGQPKFTVKASQSFSQVGMEFYDLVNANQFYELNWEKQRNSYHYSSIILDKEGKPVLDADGKMTYGVPYGIAGQLASGAINSYVVNGKTTTYKSVYEMLGYNPYNVPNNEIVGNDGKINPNVQFMWADDMDWTNSVRQLGLRGEYLLNYSGATDKTDYFVSAGYLNERGYMKKSKFNRASVRANVNTQATKWLKTGVNISGNISEAEEPGTGDPYYYPLYTGPIYPLHVHDANTKEYILDENGNKKYDFGNGEGGHITRPINSSHNVAGELPHYEIRYRRSLLAAKTYAEIKFCRDFTFTTNYSADLNTYYSSNYTPKIEGIASPGRLVKQTSQRLTWDFNQLLRYEKQFGKLNVSVTAGHEAWATGIFNMSGERSQQMVTGITELSNFAELNDLSSYQSDYHTEAYLTKGDFIFDDKYVLQLSYRYDGSSKFYKDTRWDSFYGAGISWRIDKEAFMKDVDWVDMLKFRTSYGTTGNSSSVGYYAWQSLYGLYSNAGVPGFAIKPTSTLGNKDLKWETNSNADIALEFALFKRLSGTVEFFSKQSGDMLYSMPLNPSTGFSRIYTNAFSMVNKGFEVELSADIIKNPQKGFRWKLSANATHYKNKVTDMNVEPYRNDSKRIEAGHSIYEFSMYHFEGVDKETGLSMYTPEDPETADVYEYEGKKVTNDTNNAKFLWAGSAIPKIYGGLQSKMSYKNFDLTLYASYQFGGKTYDGNYKSLMTWSSTTYGRSIHADMLKRWQNPGDITDVPRLDATDAIATNQAGGGTGGYSDRWLVSNDYFELTSVNLNYNLPGKILKPYGIEAFNIYFNGDMLFRMTARKGLNVRYNFNGTVGDGYLPARVYTIGFNLKF
ncbi:MAG: SusC/RagA family TonB-linked outer membrane protein [Tannerella sp.]|jgi:TonB-linked SusC/RagA family outer membrane protein|nr:SusC/RagA family TonB-linked outer membrane protein [Tannerella sp.]